MSIPQIKQIVGVIDIGTSAIRMVVAEIGQKNEIRYLENLQKPVRFGHEVFKTGRLSPAAIREAIGILKNYKIVLEGYGVKKVQTIATSAVREAVNRDNFVDQVFVRTGFDVEVIEGPEENRLELIAVEQALSGHVDLQSKNCLIVEVGSGSTEVILLNQGNVEVTRTLSLGSIRLPEQAVAGKTDSVVMQKVLKRSIHDVVLYAAREYNFEQVDTFIAIGGDMRFAASHLQKESPGPFCMIEKKAFVTFINQIGKLTPDEVSAQYGLSYTDAETLYPALLVYANFLSETKVEQVIVPGASIRDGLLIELAQMVSTSKRTDVSKQVLNSARHLAQKYQYDKIHAACVASLALKIFDGIGSEYGLGSRERLLLEVSAVLHDIGVFISPAAHHKHSSYLVDAAEIFGLRKADKDIVSNVVRYHRRSVPSATHVPYMSLPKIDRAVVSKLAAILRVADALDHGHQQKIRQLTMERTDEACVFWIPEDCGDVSLERGSLQDKGALFGEVFGLLVALKQGSPGAKA